jgi:hypothetical protein
MQFGKITVSKGSIFFVLFFLLPVFISESTAQTGGSNPTSQSPTADSRTQSSAPQQPAANPSPVFVGPDQELHLRTEDGIDPKTMRPRYESIVEDWSNLAIGNSDLHAQPPLVAQTEDMDTITRILVQVKWRPGDPIDLYVILPKGVKNPPAVLYLYGHDQDTDRFKDNRWCGRATGGGVAAVGFVSALTGQRFHDRPMKQWFVSELQESLGSTVHDVKFILDYLASRGDVDMSRIGMFGQGSGATIAILAAAADPRIKAIDLLDPWGDWPVWLAKSSVVKDDPNKAVYLKPQFLKKVAPLDPVKWLPTLKSVHIRLQQPMDADPVPRVCKDRIKVAMPKTKDAELVRFDTVNELYQKEGGGYLFQWIKGQLKSLPEASPKMAATENASSQSMEDHPSSNRPQ